MLREERTGRLLKGAIAIFMLAQFALVQAMAASPGFHEELHCHEHDHHSHEPCAVDLWLASGGGEPPSPVSTPLPAETLAAPLPRPPGAGRALLPPAHLAGGIAAHSPPRAP